MFIQDKLHRRRTFTPPGDYQVQGTYELEQTFSESRKRSKEQAVRIGVSAPQAAYVIFKRRRQLQPGKSNR